MSHPVYSTDSKSRLAAAKYIKANIYNEAKKLAISGAKAAGGIGKLNMRNTGALVSAIDRARMQQHDPEGLKKMDELKELEKRMFYDVWAQRQRDAQIRAGKEAAARVAQGYNNCTHAFVNDCADIGDPWSETTQHCVGYFGDRRAPLGNVSEAWIDKNVGHGKFKCKNKDWRYSQRACHMPTDRYEGSCYKNLVTNSNAHMRSDLRSVMEQKNFEETKKKLPWFTGY